MRDPLRNYDAWLEAPIQRMYAEADAELEAWDAFCESRNGPDDETVETILGPRPAPKRVPIVPPEAWEKDHPDHAIYVAWLELENAIQGRGDRLWAEQEAGWEEEDDSTD